MAANRVTLEYKDRGVTLGAEPTEHLTPTLLRAINQDLAEAVRAVERREAERVSVTLAIVVGRDKEDQVAMAYSRRGVTVEKGRLQVTPTGQGRLMEEEE